jgi:Ca2+-transporting ATPase
LPEADVATRLQVDPAQGLSGAEAEARLRTHGPNELIEGHRRSPIVLFLQQFTSPLVVVLMAAAAISSVLHDIKDSLVIGVILVLNGIIGFIQEYRADRSMQALRRLSLPQVRVRRDGREATVDVTGIVPGDLVLLQAGDLVPADARVCVAANLRVDEAPLTGESEPVDKAVLELSDPDLPLGDRRNMLYRGTSVVYGRGEALVVATGMQTELGSIAAALQSAAETETPLQRRLARLGKALAVWALALCAAILGIGLLRGEPLKEMLMTAVALAVAAIPEGLPAVVTIALALGARRMARRNALVRSLPAVEGLGAVTVICTDKTGTLTRNEMTVTHLVADDQDWEVTGVGCQPVGQVRPLSGQGPDLPPVVQRLLVAGALCNDATVEFDLTQPDQCDVLGDPTEGALLTVALKAGVVPAAVQQQWPRVDEVPFDSDRKRMATRHEADGQVLVAAKGSPETLLPVCARAWWGGREQPLDDVLRKHVLERVQELARRGRRVLALADRSGPVPAGQALDADLTFLGLVGIIDPPRPEARDAVAECHSAGIRTVMITGDHKLTAQAIATELGMLPEGEAALSGPELDELSPAEFVTQVGRVSVFARVTPEHKLRLVQALQDQGHIVAMTGDGVNDAPALRQADIGVAMGGTGTDVAREASRLVLADDNFATIVAAVREGRVIFDNMRKFLRFLLNTNLAEILTMAVALVLGWPVPLLALQILWINLVTDGLPALALGFEPADPDVMRRRPRDPRQSLFTAEMVHSILINGAFMTAAVIYVMRLGTDLVHQRTIAFTTLALAQMASCLACRSERKLIAEIGFFSNPQMLGAVALTVLAQAAVVYVPFLQRMFQTVPLSLAELGECLGATFLVFLGMELGKIVSRHLRRSD